MCYDYECSNKWENRKYPPALPAIIISCQEHQHHRKCLWKLNLGFKYIPARALAPALYRIIVTQIFPVKRKLWEGLPDQVLDPDWKQYINWSYNTLGRATIPLIGIRPWLHNIYLILFIRLLGRATSVQGCRRFPRPRVTYCDHL